MRLPNRWWVMSLLATVALALTSIVIVASPPSAAAHTFRCNGLARLCSRTVGEVAFPTAHNAMSSPHDGFRGPNQGKPMSWQLDHGIRGFQIDAYEGVAVGDRVWTNLQGAFAQRAPDQSTALVSAAVAIHERLGAPPTGTPTEVYLCHVLCEIGAVRMSEELRTVRAFLDRNPDEVLLFVIEDYVPPQRLRTLFDDAGLGNELVAYTPGVPLPTLGKMIQAHRRLLVSLENGDGGAQLSNAFAGLVEETPYSFARVTDLRGTVSCSDNRGMPGSPIFQLNHWVTPPLRRSAPAANRLLATRIDTCRSARGRIPTLLAIDFADQSNVVRIANRLNRGLLVR